MSLRRTYDRRHAPAPDPAAARAHDRRTRGDIVVRMADLVAWATNSHLLEIPIVPPAAGDDLIPADGGAL